MLLCFCPFLSSFWSCSLLFFCTSALLENKPPLPSIFLTNARSLANKLDELKLQITANKIVGDSCILFILETWHHLLIVDTAIELAGRIAHRHDRTKDIGKSRGGGLCIYLNNSYCTNKRTVASHCSSDLDYVSVKCRPIYLPREFNVVMLIAVYIPPAANASTDLGLLHHSISSQ